MRWTAAIGVVFVCSFAAPAAAQAPFVTDDAAVTAPRHWHVELFEHWADLPRAAAPATGQSTLIANLGFGLAGRRPRLAVVGAVVAARPLTTSRSPRPCSEGGTTRRPGSSNSV